MYVVIDTWVWKKAAEPDETCLSLLSTLFRQCRHTVVCDLDGEIESEYLKNLKYTLLQKLFYEMIKKGKVEKKNRFPIENDFGFDPSDLKFLEVAILIGAVIISGDKDFNRLKQKLQTDTILSGRLKNMKIISPTEAIDCLIE